MTTTPAGAVAVGALQASGALESLESLDSPGAPEWAEKLERPPVGKVVVRVERGDEGRLVFARLESSGALAARRTPDALVLVGAGAHLVGDDKVEIGVELGAGTSLTVRSTGASVARRGHEGGTSVSTTSARVGDGATLCWLVEPGIATGGSRHVAKLGFDISSTARLCWREEVVLGRFGEDKPGSWSSRMRLVLGGRTLLVNHLDLGHEAHARRSPTVVGDARAVVGITIIDPALGEDPSGLGDQASDAAAQGVVCALAGPGVELMAWGRELEATRAVAGLLLSRLEMPWLPRELLAG